MFSHLSEQKQLSLVGFLFVCVRARRECVGVFLRALLPSLSAAAGPGKPGSFIDYIYLQIFISSLQGRVAWSQSWQFTWGVGCNHHWCSAFASWLWTGTLSWHLRHWRGRPVVMVVLILLYLQWTLPPSPPRVLVAPHSWRSRTGNGETCPCPFPIEGTVLSN